MANTTIKTYKLEVEMNMQPVEKQLNGFATFFSKKMAEIQGDWANMNAEIMKDNAKVASEIIKSDTKIAAEKQKTVTKTVEMEAKKQIELAKLQQKAEIEEEKRQQRRIKEQQKAAAQELKIAKKAAKDNSEERIAALKQLEIATKEYEAKQRALREAGVKENETDGVKQIGATRNRLKAEADLYAAEAKRQEAMMNARLIKVKGNAEAEMRIRQRAEAAITRNLIAESKKRDDAGEIAATKLQKSARFGEDIATIAGGGLQNANFTGLGATIGDMVGGPIGGAIGTAIGGAVTLLMQSDLGKKLAEMFTPASDKINNLSQEITEIGDQVAAMATASATINLAISTGSGEDFNAALAGIKEAIAALPEDADVARSQLQAMMNVPGGPTVEQLRQIDEQLKQIRGEGDADILAKQFEIGNLALQNFSNNVISLADARSEAEGNAAEQARIDREIQDEIKIATESRLRLMEAQAAQSGQAFDLEKARAQVAGEIAMAWDTANGFIDNAMGFTDSLVQSNYDVLGTVNGIADGYSEISNEQARSEEIARQINDTMSAQEAISKSLIDDAKTYGQTQEEQVRAEVNQLKIKQANMKAVKAAIDAQIRALKQFISSQAVSIKAEQDRKRAAEDLAKQQKIIADIMEAQKRGVAYSGATTTVTTSGQFNAGEANAQLAKLEADSAALERGINAIGKDIDSLEKTGKKRSEIEKGGAKRAEDDEKKRIERVKKQAEREQKLAEDIRGIDQKRLDDLEKLADEERQKKVKQQQDEIKQSFDDMKVADQRRDAEKQMVKNIKEAGKSILDSISANVDRSYSAVNNILNGFRSKSEQLLNKIDEMRTKQSDESDKILEKQRDLQAKITELTDQISEKTIQLGESEKQGGPAARQLRGLQAEESDVKEDIIDMQAQMDTAIARAKATIEAFKDSSEFAKLTAERTKILGIAENKRTQKQKDRLEEIDATINTITGQLADVTAKYADEQANLRNKLQQVQEEIQLLTARSDGWTDRIKSQTAELDKLNASRTEEVGKLKETEAALAGLKGQSFAGQVEEAATAVAEIGGRIKERGAAIVAGQMAGSKAEADKARGQVAAAVSLEDIRLLQKYAEVMKGAEYQTAIANETDEKRKQLLIDTQKVTENLIQDMEDQNRVDQNRIGQQKLWQDAVTSGYAKVSQSLSEYKTRTEEAANANKSFEQQAREAVDAQMQAIKDQIQGLKNLQDSGAQLTDEQKQQLQDLGEAYKQLQGDARDATGAIAQGVTKDADVVGEKIQKVMGYFKQAADGFNDVTDLAIQISGGEMKTTDKVIAGAELAQKVGEALLNSKNPKIKMIGAFIVGAALITKAVAKIVAAIKGEGMDAQQRAQLQADVEKSINDLYQARLEILQDLKELGDTSIDQAKEILKAEQAIFNASLLRSDEMREMNELSSQQIAMKKVELLQEKALLEIKLAELNLAKDLNREQRKDVLDKYGISYSGSTKGETNDAITETNARLTEINTTLGIADTILTNRNKLLERTNEILNEQLEINKLLISLGADEEEQLRRNVKLTADAISDKLSGVMSAARYGEGRSLSSAVRKEIGDVQKALKSGDVEKAKKEMLDLPEDILFAIKDQVGAWQDSTTALQTYFDNLKKASAELEKQNDIFEDRKKLNAEKLRSGEITEQQHNEELLKILDEQYAVVLASANAYETQLKWQIALETIEADRYELMKKMNGEQDASNAKLNKMIQSYQKLLRDSRAGIPGADAVKLQQSRSEIEAYLKSIGQTPEQIEAFLNTLPARRMGGPLDETGPFIGHKGEYVAKPEAVKYYGQDFFEKLNALAIKPGKAETFLGQFDKAKSAQNIINNANIRMQITQYQNFAAMSPDQAKDKLGASQIGLVQRALDEGKIQPNRAG